MKTEGGAGNQKDRNRPHLYLFLSFPFVFCNLFLWSFKEASSSVIARILCLKAKAILSEDYQAVNHCLILVKWAPENEAVTLICMYLRVFGLES